MEGGTVALAEAMARWTDKLGRVSDRDGQFGERVGKPGGRRHVGPEIVQARAEVRDEGMRSDDDPDGAVALYPRIGRRRAFSRPWSVSMRLFAFTSVSRKAGSNSSRTRG
jgi:hypothetical protein